MIEMPIPNDIRKYESKFLGPFTLRQFVCGIPTLAIFLLVLIFVPIEDTFTKMLIATIPALPFILCGFIKIQGLPFEKFARTVFVSQILAPVKRVYKTDNTYKNKKTQNQKNKKEIEKRAKKRFSEKDKEKRAFK